MALPNQLNKDVPAGSDLPSTLDNRIRNAVLAVEDILGIPDQTNISTAATAVTTNGMESITFADRAANPATTGRVQRNGTVLAWFDGTLARNFVYDTATQTLTNKTLTSPTINSPTINTPTITSPAITQLMGGAASFNSAVTFESSISVAGHAMLDPNPWNLTATVAGSALTVSLVGQNGSVPSATNPVPIKFRNVTLTTASNVTRNATTTTAVTAPAGASFGFTAALASRLYVVALDNAGTVELGLYHPWTLTNGLRGLNEYTVASSTTMGTGSDSAYVIYSTTGRSNVAIRILGYIDITGGATPGNWDNEDTVITIMGPGVPRTGDRIAFNSVETGAVATGTTVLPHDDTAPPLDTEGDQYMTVMATPSSALSILRHTVNWWGTSTGGVTHSVALFNAATVNAIAAVSETIPVAGEMHILTLYHQMSAGGTGGIVFNVRAGNSSAGTTTFNGTGGGRIFAGIGASYFSVEEICR